MIQRADCDTSDLLADTEKNRYTQHQRRHVKVGFSSPRKERVGSPVYVEWLFRRQNDDQRARRPEKRSAEIERGIEEIKRRASERQNPGTQANRPLHLLKSFPYDTHLVIRVAKQLTLLLPSESSFFDKACSKLLFSLPPHCRRFSRKYIDTRLHIDEIMGIPSCRLKQTKTAVMLEAYFYRPDSLFESK